ncbi:MAG: metal-dependent hydrolase [Saprospiraceae bacterium]|nr:metal-dependent hydrolase [Saprospiraceae bacterium]
MKLLMIELQHFYPQSLKYLMMYFSKHLKLDKKLITSFLIIILGWFLVYIGHYYVVPNAKTPILIALSDPSVHGLVTVCIFLPLYIYNLIDFKLFFYIVLVSVLIDIDHAVAAKSFDIKAMLSLGNRPISHSLLFSLLFGSLITLISYKFYKIKPIVLTYFFSFALSSHVLRDAIDSNNTPWAYPLNSFPISAILFFIFYISLSIIHLYFGHIYRVRK